MNNTIAVMIFVLFSISLIGCQKYNLIIESGRGGGEYAKGEVVQISANTAKEGFKFYRWEGDYQYLEDRYNTNTFVKMDKTSITLKAEYVSIYETYSLTVTDGKGSGDYLPGDDIKLTAYKIDPPEEFYNWRVDCNLEDLNLENNDLMKNNIFIKMPRRDVSIYAKFDILYSVLIINGKGSGRFPKDTMITIDANQAEKGYVFDEWIGDDKVLSDPTKESLKFIMPKRDIELEATYKLEPKYELKIINGTGSGSYKAGTRRRITANDAIDGYLFDGWTGDTDILQHNESYKTYIITMPARNISLEATYKKMPDYLVTVNHGTGDGRYKPGETVNIMADEANEGFLFSNWEGDDDLLEDRNASSTSFIMPEKSVTLNAYYKKPEKFMVVVEDGTGDGRYKPGETVNIMADEANEGFSFSHWEGDDDLLRDKNASSTSFIMPEKSVMFNAFYKEADYYQRYHHTTSGSVDGGTSIVLCPGQAKIFDTCSVNGVNIPYVGKDEGRYAWWNMRQVLKGDMICTGNGKTYKFIADLPFRAGFCN